MDKQYIISKMNQYIHRSANLLVFWLEDKLSSVYDDWWNVCVMDRLSSSQRKNVIEKGYKKLSELDFVTVLRIADKNWYDISNFAHLPMSKRECIREMQGVRNNWVYCSNALPGKDVIIHDIDVMVKFWGQMEASQTELIQLETFKKYIENENIADKLNQKNMSNGINNEKSVYNAEIKEKDTVLRMESDVSESLPYM